ncbi:MAG: DNA polymerase III subunit delta [Pseudomonadota bacterium]
MQVSGRTGQSFLDKPDPSAWAVLIHSSDEGIAGDAEAALLKSWEKTGPIERLRLAEDEIARDATVLFDRLEAQSLLGDQAVLRLRLSNEKLSALLSEAVLLEEKSPGRFGAKLVLTAGSLKKTSKLRKTFESAERAWAIHMFEDDVSDIRTIITGILSEQNHSISESALDHLSANLPGHRRLARQEVEKLALYAYDLNRPITLEDVEALSTSDIDHALSAMVSAAFTGDSGGAVRELDKLEAASQSPITLLRGLQRKAVQLLDAHGQGTQDARDAGRLRPPVWSSEWASFKSMMQAWPPGHLVRLVARIEDCEAQAKTSSQSAGAVVRNLVTGMLRYADRA